MVGHPLKVLVIAPHMDDEVLGVGGTIAKHVANGDEVNVCIVANRAYDHEYDREVIQQERQATLRAKEILGYHDVQFFDLNDERLDERIVDVLIPIEEYLLKIKPDVVYVNHRGDIHQDHRAVFSAALIATRAISGHKVKKVLCYETPSTSEQAPPFVEYAFSPNFYVDISEFLKKKLEGVKAYTREGRAFPHPRSPKAIRILAQKRGVEVGFAAAEAFMILRDEWA